MATKDTLHRKFSEICRLCLKQDGVMASIFQTVDNEEGDFSLAQRISTIARVQVCADDGLPALICHICRQQVEKSYNFRLLVEISDRTLRNCLEVAQAETMEEQVTIKQELSDSCAETTGEENIDLEQFLLQNNLTNSNIDPAAINVILVQSEDGTQVLNICSIDDTQDNENSDESVKIKNENLITSEKGNDTITPEVCEQDEIRPEVEHLEDIRNLLHLEKMYVQGLESQVKAVYACNECDKMFLTVDELTDHFSVEHGEDSEHFDTYDTNISCQLCFETFQSLAELKNHITEHFTEGKTLDSIKSETNADKQEKELSDTIDNVIYDDCQYILEVSKSEENCPGMITQRIFDAGITEHTADNELNKNKGEDKKKSKCSNDGNNSSQLELDLSIGNDLEYKSDVLYCVREYLSDRGKTRSTNIYPCTQCDKTFTQKHEHTLHLRRHLGIKPFKCTFCDKAFITNALRKEHERGHTGDKAFVCVVCGKSFVKKSELKYHEGVHTDTPSTCNICNKEFTNVQSFKMHAKRHVLGSRYVCETCGKSYYTNSELARHVQMHSGKREYPCSLCHTSFLSRPELNRHLRYHIGKKTFRCKICCKSYFESGHLKIHERVHTGEKPFVCQICNKAFITRPKLARHEKIHAKEQIVMCVVDDRNQQNVEAVKIKTISE